VGLYLRANYGGHCTSGAAFTPPTLDVAVKLQVPAGLLVTLVTSGE